VKSQKSHEKIKKPNPKRCYLELEISFDNMKAFAARHALSFPYVIDTTQDVARAYDAQCTPDFLGFNAQDERQYRGRLDASRMAPIANARRDLFEAMKQIAETGHGPKEQISSMGCSIKWKHRDLAAGIYWKGQLKSFSANTAPSAFETSPATIKGYPTAPRQTSLHQKLQMIV
jgi:hypothetical protein